ncbi:MAG TPA: hypothetical protein VFM14_10815 [Gemmatimonadales bacterium]|nr:hypothetical protein [Gemmatimonadales bacterium]
MTADVTTAGPAPERRRRALVAALLGLTAAAYVLYLYGWRKPLNVSDFDAIWAGARALRGGEDPYAVIQSPPWPWELQYPLTTVLVALPFSFIPLALARAVFVGLSTALLAWGLTRSAWWPLWMLAGGQMLLAVEAVQWTPLFAAGILLPSLRWLWAAKPTTGAVLFAAYPDRRTVIGGVVLLALAFVLLPSWTEGWLGAAGRAPHRPGVLRFGGALLLLALFRWRLPEARQVAAVALVPLSPHIYEALPLLLLARTRREMLLLTLLGSAGFFAALTVPRPSGPDHGPIPWAIVFFSCYLPALLVVLLRRKAGTQWLTSAPIDRAAS